MNEIVSDLQIAKKKQLLINVYRIDDQIFYTGYVEYLDNQEVVLRTFDYLGLVDGMSLLKLDCISEIELESEDIDLMRERIQLSEKLNLISVATNFQMYLKQSHHWIKEILGRSYVEQQVVMLIVFDDNNHFTNIEGMVQKLGTEYFSFMVLNKNHFDRRKIVQFRYVDIGVVEFLGEDLTQMTRHQELLLATPHIEREPIREKDAVDNALQKSIDNQSLVEIESNLTNRYFYVGTVKAFNNDQYVLKLVDMNGQFGGYSILRRDSIKTLWQSDDYLTYMKACIQNNREHQRYLQPVLNDEREFDSKTNMMKSVLELDVRMKRFLRLQTTDDSQRTKVGVIIRLDDQKIEFEHFDDLIFEMLPNNPIPWRKLGEVAFGYLDVILSQTQFINRQNKRR